MEKPWKFITDTHSNNFCRNIAAEMVRLFGITEDEAIGRINQGWGHIGEFHSIAYHEPAEYWAHHMYFGHDSYWWIRDEGRARASQTWPYRTAAIPVTRRRTADNSTVFNPLVQTLLNIIS